jgi:pimeloyl-ACP methyl ester carboxylesterase
MFRTSHFAQPDKSTIVRSFINPNRDLATSGAPLWRASQTHLPGPIAAWAAARFLTPHVRTPSHFEKEPDAQPLWLGTKRLWLRSWGQGPAILLVHGWAGAAAQLEGFVAPLVDRGFRVLAVDMPAHGKTAGRRTSLGEFIRVIERVHATVGELYGVIAHSLGASAAVLAESRGLALERLVLMAPMPSFDFAISQFGDALGLTAPLRERVAALVEARVGLQRGEADLGAMLSPSARTLLIHDAKDRLIDVEQSRTLSARWAGVEYLETNGLGHRRVLKAPEVRERALTFVGNPPTESQRSLERALGPLPEFRF